MKLGTLTLATALVFATAAMAQTAEADGQAAAPAETAPAYEPAPAAAAPAGEADFGSMRGRAYNIVGNQAGVPTVGNYLDKPHTLHGRKMVYVEPTNSFAALSFGEGSTKFLAFDNSVGLGMMTLGLATKGFGASFDYAFGKRWRFDTDKQTGGAKVERDITNITAGDLLQARFSVPAGAYDLAARAFWITYRNETETKTESSNAGTTTTTESDQDFWDYGAEVTVSNDPSAKDLFWSAGVLFVRHAADRMTKGGGTTRETNDPDATVTLQPNVNVGLAVLKSDNARVLVGVNGSVPFSVYDGANNKNTNVKDSRFTLDFVATPNILGELALGESWLLFAGAAYFWEVLDVDHETYVTGNGTPAKETLNTTILSMTTNTAFVNAGARFQRRNFAVEASVANNFFNNPLEGFNGTNFIANLGGFIYF